MFVLMGFACLMVFDTTGAPRPHRTIDEAGGIIFHTWPHIILCLAAAFYAGRRIFTYEYQRGTLQELLILPYTPARWLLLKFTFPLALVAAAWACCVPFYIVATIIHVTSPAVLIGWMWYPLIVGMGALFFLLLLPPAYLRRWQRQGESGTYPDLEARESSQADSAIRAAFFPLLAVAVLVPWHAGFDVLLAWKPFYIAVAPAGFVWMSVLVAIVWAALYSAIADISGNDYSARRAALIRWSALGVIHYLVLGLLWNQLEIWMQWSGLALFPVIYLATTKWFAKKTRAHRFEDPWTAPELVWLQAHWDNPAFMKDWRVYSRSASLRRQMMASLPNSLIAAAIVYGFFSYSGFINVTGPLIVYLFSQETGQMLGDSVARLWGQEQRGSTLGLIAISPIGTSDWLKGRFAATLLNHTVGRLCYLTPSLATLLLIYHGAPHTYLAHALTLIPFSLVGMIWRGGCPLHPTKRSRSVNSTEALLILLEVILFAGCIALMTFAVRLAAGLVWLLAVALFGAGMAALPAWFHLRCKELEACRRGDIELTEDKTEGI